MGGETKGTRSVPVKDEKGLNVLHVNSDNQNLNAAVTALRNGEHISRETFLELQEAAERGEITVKSLEDDDE